MSPKLGVMDTDNNMEIDPVAAHQVGHAVPALHQAAGPPTMYGHQYVGTPLGGSPLRGLPPEEESVPALGRGGGALPVLHQREQVLGWAALPLPWPENPNAGRDSAHLASSRSEIQYLEHKNTQTRNEAVQALHKSTSLKHQIELKLRLLSQEHL